MVIANHMKKSYVNWNNESIEDRIIFEHLKELSKGKIDLINEHTEGSSAVNLSNVRNNQFQNRSNNANTSNSGNRNTAFQNRNNQNNNNTQQRNNTNNQNKQNNNGNRFVKKTNTGNNSPKNTNRNTN